MLEGSFLATGWIHRTTVLPRGQLLVLWELLLKQFDSSVIAACSCLGFPTTSAERNPVPYPGWIFCTETYLGVGELSQQLTMLTAFPEDLSSISNPHVWWWLTTTCNSKRSNTLSRPSFMGIYTHMVHTQRKTQIGDFKKIFKELERWLSG